MIALKLRPLLLLASVVVAPIVLAGCSMGDHGSHTDEGHGVDKGHHGDEEEGSGHHDGAEDGDHHESVAGQPGKAPDVTRTVTVDMSDAMDYSPSSLVVEQGETLRLEVSNRGQLLHELVLGSTEEILEHHELMKRFPGMEHEEKNQISLAAGETGEIIWTFSNAGTVNFACLQPGHFEAGMKGEIDVVSPQ